MIKWSPRAWVLGGFLISLSSVVLNTVALAQVNLRLAAVNSELSGLKDSMARTATEMQRAENKYEMVRLFHWVAMQVPEKQRETARQEAAYVLVNYFTRTYAAIHDIPPAEVIKTEMVEMEDDYVAMKKIHDLAKQAETADEKEKERILKDIDKVDTDSIDIPKTPLGKEFAKLKEMGYAEASAEDESDLLLVIAPTLQSLRDDFIKAHGVKSARIKELEARRGQLTGIQSITSYLAVGLQLLGLFFILSRDVVKDINDKKKAEASSS